VIYKSKRRMPNIKVKGLHMTVRSPSLLDSYSSSIALVPSNAALCGKFGAQRKICPTTALC